MLFVSKCSSKRCTSVSGALPLAAAEVGEQFLLYAVGARELPRRHVPEGRAHRVRLRRLAHLALVVLLGEFLEYQSIGE